MNEHQLPDNPNNKPSNEHMQKRIDNLFAGQELPAHASLKEVEAMKNRIHELEENLKQQEAKAILVEKEALQNRKLAQTFASASSQDQVASTPAKSVSWLTKFWDVLTKAHPSITEIRERNIARLAASFLFVILLLELNGGIVRTLQEGFASAFSGTFLLSIIATLISYILSRTKWISLAVFLFAMFFSSLAYFTIATEGMSADVSTVMLVYVPLSLVVASAFLSSWAVFLLIGLNIFAYVVTIRNTFTTIPDNFGVQAGIITTIGMVLILLTNFRKRAEQQSLQEIKKINDEMQSSNKELILGREQLEQRVVERTHDLELATEVGRTISEKIGNLSDLLSQSVELIRSNYKLYYTQLYLLDTPERNLVLRAGTGEAGKQLLQRSHRLAVSANSLNSRAALTQKPIVVSDTNKSADFLPNPLLPNTRSELAVPLIFNGKVVGVLDMQSDKPETFSEVNIPAFEVLTGQLVIAIQNSILLNQTEEARLLVQEQASRLTSSGWQDFLNAVDRSENLGYVLNQEEILPLTETQEKNFENKLVVPIQVAGESVGEVLLAGDANRQWSSSETEIVQATMQQVAQHIENLRLLAQSEKYRAEAEQVSRRLTSEGWGEILSTRKELADGYIYSKNQVLPLHGNGNNESVSALSYPLVVRDESIGKIEIESTNENESYTQDLVGAVVEKLSNHIESLRLLEQTEERREELRLNESKLSNALDIARLGNWEYNLEKDIFTFNDSFYSVFRTNIETVGSYEMSSAEYAQRFVHPDDAALVGEEIGLVIQSTEREINKYLEHRAIFPDGSIGHIGVNIHVERNESGKITTWNGANQDITERKTAQEIMATRANQLETVATVSTTASTVLNPDALLQQVVNLTKTRFNLYHAHIYLLDENWNTLLLASGAGEVGAQMVESGHAIEMTTERSLVARAARERQPIIINDVRSEVGFLANPLLPDTRAEMAIPMVVGDNVLGVFDVQSTQIDAFSKEDASIYSTLASQIAVALQNARLYQEQSATVTQLRELDRLKSSFLANMSHELRTPLNSILGFTEVMLEGLDGPLTPNMDNDLKLINKNGQHLLHLINDVLDMAKIESGKLNLIIEKFSVQEIFEEVINITSPLANEKKLTLKIDTKSDNDVAVNADRTRIRQVMINLVNNALKFTEKGKIIIRAIREENSVLISVKDTGMGIPPEHLEAVFSEFTQVDSSTTRKAGGTGLGLPISRRLIEMHGGKLWAESTGVEGEGSTFFVFMPLENRTTVSEPVTRKI